MLEENKVLTKKECFIVKNVTILLLFILSVVLLFVAQCSTLISSAIGTSETGGSGFFIILVPIIAIMSIFLYIIPQFIGIILSIANMKKKNSLLSIFIFIIALISLLMTIFASSSLNISGGMFALCVIGNVALSIITLIKSIIEIKKIHHKGVLITYSICIISLLLYTLFYGLALSPNFNFTNQLGYLILSLAPLFVFWICFVVLVILGIISLVKNKEKNTRKNIIIILIIVLCMGISFQLIPLGMKKLSFNIYKNQTIENIINPLSNRIKHSDKNKMVYLMPDLEEMANKELNLYSDTSYITYYDEKIYVCITNGKYNVEGYEGQFKVTETGLLNDACNYKFDTSNTSEGEKYLKKYLSEKYKIEITNVKAVVESQNKFDFVGWIDHFDVETNYGTFEAMVEVKDGKVVVTDKYKEYSDNLSTNEVSRKNLLLDIEKFTKEYLNIDEITIKTTIYDINPLQSNEDIIVIGSSYSHDDAKVYANALGNYLVKNNDTAKIMIRKMIRNDNNEIEHEYVVYVIIENGKLTIE